MISQQLREKPTTVSGPDLILDSPSDTDDGAGIGFNFSPRIKAREDYQEALKRGESILATSRLPPPSSLSNSKSQMRIDLEKRGQKAQELATGEPLREGYFDKMDDQTLRDFVSGQETAIKLSYDNMMEYIKRNPRGTFEKYILGTEDAENYHNNRTQGFEEIYNQALADYLRTNPSKSSNTTRENQKKAENILSHFDSAGSVSSPIGTPTYDSEGGSRRRKRRTRGKSIRKKKKYKKNR